MQHDDVYNNPDDISDVRRPSLEYDQQLSTQDNGSLTYGTSAPPSLTYGTSQNHQGIYPAEDNYSGQNTRKLCVFLEHFCLFIITFL